MEDNKTVVAPDYKKDITDTMNLIVSKRMLHVVPFILWSSLSYTIYSGSFVILMNKTMDSTWSDNKKTQNSMYAMIALGFGEIFGSIICGKIMDTWG